MTLSEAIISVLAAHDSGTPIPTAAVEHLRSEVAGPFELWGVQSPNVEEAEPEHIVHGTKSEHAAWNNGVDWTDGWNDPATFTTEQEAIDHINENEGTM